MSEETATQETITAYDKGDKSTLLLVKRLETGHMIGQAATLIDGGTSLKNNSFYLVNPFGRILIHDNDVETLEKFAKDPVKLDRLEKTGSVSE